MTATNIGQKVVKRKEWMSNHMWNAKLEATQDSLHMDIVLDLHSVLRTAFTQHVFHKAKPRKCNHQYYSTLQYSTVQYNVDLADSYLFVGPVARQP